MNPMENVFELVKQAVDREYGSKMPPLGIKNSYMIVYTTLEEDETSILVKSMNKEKPVADLKLCENRDLEQVEYYGEARNLRTGANELSFFDPTGQIVTFDVSTYGKSWVLLETNSILGGALAKAYRELTKAMYEQLPPELKGRVKVK